jgi:hypothetical protein
VVGAKVIDIPDPPENAGISVERAPQEVQLLLPVHRSKVGLRHAVEFLCFAALGLAGILFMFTGIATENGAGLPLLLAGLILLVWTAVVVLLFRSLFPPPERIVLRENDLCHSEGRAPLFVPRPFMTLNESNRFLQQELTIPFRRRRTTTMAREEIEKVQLLRVGRRAVCLSIKGDRRLFVGELVSDAAREWLASVLRRWLEGGRS